MYFRLEVHISLVSEVRTSGHDLGDTLQKSLLQESPFSNTHGTWTPPTCD